MHTCSICIKKHWRDSYKINTSDYLRAGTPGLTGKEWGEHPQCTPFYMVLICQPLSAQLLKALLSTQQLSENCITYYTNELACQNSVFAFYIKSGYRQIQLMPFLTPKMGILANTSYELTNSGLKKIRLLFFA